MVTTSEDHELLTGTEAYVNRVDKTLVSSKIYNIAYLQRREHIGHLGNGPEEFEKKTHAHRIHVIHFNKRFFYNIE